MIVRLRRTAATCFHCHTTYPLSRYSTPSLRATTTTMSRSMWSIGARVHQATPNLFLRNVVSSRTLATGVGAFLSLCVLGIVPVLLYLYRRAIAERVRKMEEESFLFGGALQMERCVAVNDNNNIHNKSRSAAAGTVFKNLKLLELNPAFRAKYNPPKGWSLLSLGEYISSLRPKVLPKNMAKEDLPQIFQTELEGALSLALLKALGPHLGRAFLPATRILNTQIHDLASSLAVRAAARSRSLTANTASTTTTRNPAPNTNDLATLPVSVMSILALSDVNARIWPVEHEPNKKAADKVEPLVTSAMDKMKLGEVGQNLTFSIGDRFIMERDFNVAMYSMEEKLRVYQAHKGHRTEQEEIAFQELVREKAVRGESVQTSIDYDPDGRSMSEPIPINPRVLPDLYFGWGKDIKCTSTNREVVQIRLMSILLNRLAANYYRLLHGEKDLFVLQMSGKDITTPVDFIQALIRTGHHVSAVTTSRITTFGIYMCVKEKDGTWSNIPLASFLDSGYEDANGNPAPVAMPHSGLTMHVSGPFFGKRGDGSPSMLDLQQYIAPQGFCGWFPNHVADVPWLREVNAGSPVVGKEVLRAVRLAALYSIVVNGLATERHLPFGGYGLTGVCNDSAAVMEQCLHGTTSIYPLTSIGSYMMRTVRYAAQLREKFRALKGREEEVEDLSAILHAVGKLPSDLNSSPHNAVDAARRILRFIPEEPAFSLMIQSKKTMEAILNEEGLREDGGALEADTGVTA